jgi:hypothetical protein
MRSIYLLIFILSLHQIRAQENENPSDLKIKGFGKIQLGMHVSDIPELARKTDIRTAREYIKKVDKNDQKVTFELFSDTSSVTSTFFGSPLKEVRNFYLGEYAINDKIKLHRVGLSFYKDELYEINIEGSGVDELLTLKYGKPEMKHEETPHTFVNGLGIETVKTDKRYKHTYNTNIPGVVCYYNYDATFNLFGEISIFEYTILYDKAIHKLVSDEKYKVEMRIKQRAEQAKKRDIENF